MSRTPDLMKLKIPDAWLESVEEQKMFRSAIEHFKDIDLGMSHFQITNFVLNDDEFRSPADKFFHAKKEMWVRYSNLINQYQEVKLLEAEAELEEAALMDLEEKKEITRTDRANAKIHQVKADQKRMRIEMVKKEAARQLREFHAFYDNHEFYKRFVPEGATLESMQPEAWVLKAVRKTTMMERVKKWLKGEEPPNEHLRRMLSGPMEPLRQQIMQKAIAEDVKRVELMSKGLQQEQLTKGQEVTHGR